MNIIWENRQFGSIVWKQDKKFGRHFGIDFTNPDFVKLAESFGMPAWRCESVEDFGAPPAPRAHARRAVADRGADRLLARRRHLRGAGHRDGGHVIAATAAAIASRPRRRPPSCTPTASPSPRAPRPCSSPATPPPAAPTAACAAWRHVTFSPVRPDPGQIATVARTGQRLTGAAFTNGGTTTAT